MAMLAGFWRHCLSAAWTLAVPRSGRRTGRPETLYPERMSDYQLRDLGLPPRDPPRPDLWPPGRA